jgi:hypothetical protein
MKTESIDYRVNEITGVREVLRSGIWIPLSEVHESNNLKTRLSSVRKSSDAIQAFFRTCGE